MPSQLAAMSGVPFLLQDAQTTGNGNVLAIPPSFRNHTFIIKGNGAIGAGAIQLETADEPDYAGVWAAIPKPDGTASTPITVVSSADVIFTFFGVLNFVRARISTTVTTTTVTVTYRGAKSY
jgi:hypothetical protein